VKKVFFACFDRQYISVKGFLGAALSPIRNPAILKLVRMGIKVLEPHPSVYMIEHLQCSESIPANSDQEKTFTYSYSEQSEDSEEISA
jgi:hypothetical protein